MMGSLAGRRVLVVGDEALVVALIKDALASAGAIVIGHFTAVASALAAIGTEQPEIAVLDLNLAGKSSLPVADELVARGVPIVFASGYGSAGLPFRDRRGPMLAKPFDPAALILTPVRVLEAPPAPDEGK